MRQKWVYPTLLLFVVFYILSNPGAAGPQARNFVDWVGDQAGAFGTFLDGLFVDDGNPQPAVPGNNPAFPNTNPTFPGGQVPNNGQAPNDGTNSFNT
ncbi:MAG: hypothetical protein ACFCVK_17640 [Acidimicrobiales bacterium]